MGFEANATRVELAVKPFYMEFQKRPLYFDGEVADAQVKQLFVAETMPGESVAHGEQILGFSLAKAQTIHRLRRYPKKYLRNLWIVCGLTLLLFSFRVLL